MPDSSGAGAAERLATLEARLREVQLELLDARGRAHAAPDDRPDGSRPVADWPTGGPTAGSPRPAHQAPAGRVRSRRARATALAALTLALLLGGAAAVVAVPGALLGLALEAGVLGPLVARLAAGFADLPVAPSGGQALLVALGLLALGALLVLFTERP
jgi:hypothetical protein